MSRSQRKRHPVLWDAVVLPGGAPAQPLFSSLGQVKEFLKDQYRHCKPILALGESIKVLEAAVIPLTLPDGSQDLGIIQGAGAER
jgi:catalase